MRKQTKYKALEPKVNLSSRYDQISDLESYASQLNDEEKDWLNRFSHEYICANLSHGGEVLHNTEELRRDCYSKNNTRNRDIHSRENARCQLDSVDRMLEYWTSREKLNAALKDSIFDRIKKRKSDLIRELKEYEERELRGEIDIWQF